MKMILDSNTREGGRNFWIDIVQVEKEDAKWGHTLWDGARRAFRANQAYYCFKKGEIKVGQYLIKFINNTISDAEPLYFTIPDSCVKGILKISENEGDNDYAYEELERFVF